MYNNSTNLPDKLVAVAMAFVMPEGVAPPREVTVKNKQRGKRHGQWGWYYSQDQRVVVIVPRELKNYKFCAKYTKRPREFRSRAEFLVSVLAHELRHHYQHQTWTDVRSKWRLERTAAGRIAREVDAELYEHAMLDKWREMVAQQEEVCV